MKAAVAGLALGAIGLLGCESDEVVYEAVPEDNGQDNAPSSITVVCDTWEDEPHLWQGRTDSGEVAVRGDRITMENATIEIEGESAEVRAATADFPSGRCMILVEPDLRIRN